MSIRIEWTCGRCGSTAVANARTAQYSQDSSQLQMSETDTRTAVIRGNPTITLGRLDMNCPQCVGDAVALRRRLAQSEARALAAETRANNIAGNIAATIRMRIGAPRVWWRVSHLVNEALTWAAEVADSYALADDGD